jgi:hypothetical protein
MSIGCTGAIAIKESDIQHTVAMRAGARKMMEVLMKILATQMMMTRSHRMRMMTSSQQLVQLHLIRFINRMMMTMSGVSLRRQMQAPCSVWVLLSRLMVLLGPLSLHKEQLVQGPNYRYWLMR